MTQAPTTLPLQQVEILKRQLATKCTIYNDSRADF